MFFLVRLQNESSRIRISFPQSDEDILLINDEQIYNLSLT